MKVHVASLLARFLCAAVLVCGACARAAQTTPIADGAVSNMPTATTMDGARDIVIAVANPIDPPAPRVGSNLLGYARRGSYVSGQRAASQLATLKRRYGLTEIAGWPIRALGVFCIVARPPPGTTQQALLDVLAHDRDVVLAEPLREYSVYAAAPSAHIYNDPYLGLQRGFAATEAARAHNLSVGEGVDVAIIDTGVDAAHPDLAGRVRDTRNLVDVDAAAFAGDRHGTEVAGVIAAVGDNHRGIVGIAPKATLSIYKACWYPAHASAARCNSFTLAKALAAVLDDDVRIVNLSLGGPADALLEQLGAALVRNGHIVIAALPPDGAARGFPGDLPGVILVRAAVAPGVDGGIALNAPGADILTTEPGDRYDFASGSSLAAAHVSGIAALLLALQPNLDARAVHDLLQRTSAASNGIVEVNAAAAVDALDGMAKSVAKSH